MSQFLMMFITYLGVIAAAVSGVIEAKRKDMDVVGACTVGFITALGGGTLRDLLLGQTPVFWVQDQSFAIMALVVAVITFYSSRFLRFTSQSILVPDALGLGMFSVLGASYGLKADATLFVAVLMGVTTGVFGGILRDVICNEIPYVFARSAQLYATCSFAGALLFVVLRNWQTSPTVASFASILLVVGMRIIAVRYNIRLPDPKHVEIV